jgi:hypothetical protein
MLWIKFPDWSDATARLLHDTLRKAMYQSAGIEQVCRDIGMDPSRQSWTDPASALWPAVTRDAADAGLLEILVWEMRARRPALADDFSTVLTAKLPDESWYRCPDPFKSKLVGPGNKMAVLDRDGLRTGLIAITREKFPVLEIRGVTGSGRSYSRRVLQHIADHAGKEWELVIVDAELDLPDPAHAPDLIRTLAGSLGLPPTWGFDVWTEDTSKAREIVTIFAGAVWRDLPRIRRWIFLDSLDRERVKPDLHAAVGHLASKIEKGQLGETRLIVTGHPGDFPPEVLDVLHQENIEQITEKQVRTFFREVAQDIGRTLEEEELDMLVATVWAQADGSGLRALGRAVSEVAHSHFGGAA